MKLANKTRWQTRDLRRIAVRVIREEFPKARFANRAKSFTVYVGYNRGGGGWSSGHALYNSNHCYVNIPKHETPDPVDFAHVVAHEAGHCKGLRHGHMPPHMGDSTGHRSDYVKQHFAWAKPLTIRRVEKKTKVKTPDTKLVHAETMLALATTRRKRAATLETKWRQKVRYYMRRVTAGLASAACAKETTDGASGTLSMGEGAGAGVSPQ